MRFVPVAALLLALLLSPGASGGDAPRFADQLSMAEGGQVHLLTRSGEATRLFLFFRVYEMAHYIDALAAGTLLSPQTVIADGPAKAIAITFVRKLGRDQIRDEFRKSLRRNAREDWLEQARSSIDAFTDSIDRGARPGDRLTFFWLAGGRLITEFNGERVFSVTDAAFAALIWSIWFGDDPVCDSEQLLARAITAATP